MAAKYITKGRVWGVKPPMAGGVPPAMRSDDGRIKYTSEWIYHSIPVDSQGGTNACVGYTTANWVEAMLRKTYGRDILAPGEQIDGEGIWRRGRQMFWPNETVESGGLWLRQGFQAAIELGILPPGTTITEPSVNNFEHMSRHLETSPVAIAQATHQGWEMPRKDNGFIERKKGDPYQGHAILCVGLTMQAGKPFLVLQNSWGLDWGWHGLGILSESHYQLNALSTFCTAKLPPSWPQWDGWREHVKHRPETAV